MPPVTKQEGQHPLTGQRAPPISGGTYRRRRTLIDGHLEKSKYRHISAPVGVIASKFGMLMQFDPPDHSVSKIGPQ